jgi:transketolase
MTPQTGAGIAANAQMEDVFSDEAQALSTNIVGEELARLGAERPDVVIVSSDMGTTVSAFRDRYPERFFDFGIAESNAMSAAAGMAASGLVPYVISMAPFGMIKCAEQIRTDLAATKMPVRIITRMSGLSMGFFGASHHAVEDLAIARSITNLTVTASCDNLATAALLRSTIDVDGPVLIRVSEQVPRSVYTTVPEIPYGRFVRVRDGRDVTVIGTGLGVCCALDAAALLEAEGVDVGVLDAAYLKPLDEDAIVEAATNTAAILTVEEHSVVGGLGAAVAEVLARRGLSTRLGVLALPDEDLEVGVPAALLERYGLTGHGVAQRVRALLG